jgi:hypothetical protein
MRPKCVDRERDRGFESRFLQRGVTCEPDGGFGCAEIGKRLPVIRNLGAAAIFATFVPS